MTARDLFTEEPSSAPQETEPARAGTARTQPHARGGPAAAEPESSRARICCGDCERGALNAAGFVQCNAAGTLSEWLTVRTACRRPTGIAIPLTPKQIAKRAAQAGIDQAVAHAERARPGWTDAALEFIRSFAAGHKGKRLTGYELVQHSVQAGFEQPPTPQGWGGPLQRAARTGVLLKVGSVPDPNPARHGSDVPLWEVA